MQFAPWIKPADLLAAVQSGSQTGLQVAHLRSSEAQANAARAQAAQEAEANRQAAADRANQAMSLQSWEASQRMAQQAKQLADLAAYRQGELGYRTGELAVKQAKETAAEKLQNEINADTGGFLKEISSGENLDESLGRHPLASHDPTVRTILTQQAIADRGGPQGEASIIDVPGLPGVKAIRQPTGHMTLLPGEKDLNVSYSSPELGPTGLPTYTLRGPQSKVEPYMGTNAPSLRLPKTAQSGSRRVRVKSPDGTPGSIPQEQVDAAKAAGYQILE